MTKFENSIGIYMRERERWCFLKYANHHLTYKKFVVHNSKTDNNVYVQVWRHFSNRCSDKTNVGAHPAPSSESTGGTLSELSCTTFVYLVQRSLGHAIPPLLPHTCHSNLAQGNILVYNIHITRIWSASLGSLETLAPRKNRYQLIGPGALVSFHSRACKGGYTLATLPRIVTSYRDSVDETRARVTNFWYVTRARGPSKLSRYVVTIRGTVTSVYPP
jgi:hypothetical protein